MLLTEKSVDSLGITAWKSSVSTNWIRINSGRIKKWLSTIRANKLIDWNINLMKKELSIILPIDHIFFFKRTIIKVTSTITKTLPIAIPVIWAALSFYSNSGFIKSTPSPRQMPFSSTWHWTHCPRMNKSHSMHYPRNYTHWGTHLLPKENIFNAEQLEIH